MYIQHSETLEKSNLDKYSGDFHCMIPILGWKLYIYQATKAPKWAINNTEVNLKCIIDRIIVKFYKWLSFSFDPMGVKVGGCWQYLKFLILLFSFIKEMITWG